MITQKNHKKNRSDRCQLRFVSKRGRSAKDVPDPPPYFSTRFTAQSAGSVPENIIYFPGNKIVLPRPNISVSVSSVPLPGRRRSSGLSPSPFLFGASPSPLGLGPAVGLFRCYPPRPWGVGVVGIIPQLPVRS